MNDQRTLQPSRPHDPESRDNEELHRRNMEDIGGVHYNFRGTNNTNLPDRTTAGNHASHSHNPVVVNAQFQPTEQQVIDTNPSPSAELPTKSPQKNDSQNQTDDPKLQDEPLSPMAEAIKAFRERSFRRAKRHRRAQVAGLDAISTNADTPESSSDSDGSDFMSPPKQTVTAPSRPATSQKRNNNLPVKKSVKKSFKRFVQKSVKKTINKSAPNSTLDAPSTRRSPRFSTKRRIHNVATNDDETNDNDKRNDKNQADDKHEDANDEDANQENDSHDNKEDVIFLGPVSKNNQPSTESPTKSLNNHTGQQQIIMASNSDTLPSNYQRHPPLSSQLSQQLTQDISVTSSVPSSPSIQAGTQAFPNNHVHRTQPSTTNRSSIPPTIHHTMNPHADNADNAAPTPSVTAPDHAAVQDNNILEPNYVVPSQLTLFSRELRIEQILQPNKNNSTFNSTGFNSKFTSTFRKK